jgi:L,D-transpeptidase ErfK/SrfK
VLSRDGRRRFERAGGAYWCRAAVALWAVLAALPAAAAQFALSPGQQVVGQFSRYVTKPGDILPELARRFDIGYTDLVAANPGVDPWLPGVGHALLVPSVYILPDAPRRGIVVNLAQWRLFYFPPGGKRVETYPIGIGVIGWNTPIGVTRVVRKEANPVWYPPPSIRAQRPDLPALVPAGPDNPLGLFALHLGWPNYLIHGTNKPDGVGRNVSHGCIHLYPEDIARLFAEVRVGTPVRTVNQPATAGWYGNALYVAVHPSQAQVEEIDTDKPVMSDPARGVRALLRAAAGRYADAVDWNAVDKAANRRTGVPVRVAERSAVASNAAGPEEGAAPIHDRDDSSDGPRSYGAGSGRSYDGRPARPDDAGARQLYGPNAAQPYGTGSEYGAQRSSDRARRALEREKQRLEPIERMIERAAEQQ